MVMNTDISLTERAAKHVKNYLDKQGNELALRVAVKPTGCSGYQYIVEAAESVNETDQAFETQGIKVVVDNQSMPFLVGTQLDYVREGLNEGFRFNNPNVQETCGCGESFTVSEQAS